MTIQDELEEGFGKLEDEFGQLDVDQLSDSDSGTGDSNAASLDLGEYRKDFDIFVDTSGNATLTIEVSEDEGSTWRTFDTVDYNGASTEIEQYETSFKDVRAYLDQNRNTVVIVSRGI